MTISATILGQVADLARDLRYERFPEDFVFDPVFVEPKVDHDGIEYLEIFVIYDGDYQKLDPLWTANLGLKLEPALLELGVAGIPSKSYIEKSEWEAGPPR